MATHSHTIGPGAAGDRLPPEQAGRLMRRATYASVAVAAVLIVIKLVAFLITDSVAILSSLIDSVLDSVASLINLLAVHQALMPADEEHRFGHGKAESIAALGQAAFISGSAVFLVFEASSRLINPRPLIHGDVAIGVMLISIVLTFVLVRFQISVARRTGSTAITADSLHYRVDLLVNFGIIVALIAASRFGITLADPLIAIAIAIYILYSVWEILKEALQALMDREFPDQDRARVVAVANAHPQVKGVHDLRTRMSGIQPFIQLHLELDGDMTLVDAHIISDQVEAEIVAAFPGAEVIIHQDPEGVVEHSAHFEPPQGT